MDSGHAARDKVEDILIHIKIQLLVALDCCKLAI